MRCLKDCLGGLVGVIFLLIMFLIGLGSAQAQASPSPSEATQESLEEVRLLVRSAHDLAHATDLVLNEALLKDYGNGLTWLQAFSVIVAADKVVEKLEAQEYGAAALQAFLGAAHLEYGAKLSAATFPVSFAYLASAPIRLSLHLFAMRAYDAALNRQLAFYFEARIRYGKSHDFIMAGRSDDDVLFADSGWIYLVGEMTAQSYGPRIPAPQYSQEQVFGLALSLYRAKLQASDVDRRKRDMLKDFRQLLAGTSSTCIGTAFVVEKGIETCGFFLDNDGAIHHRGQMVSEPIVDSYSQAFAQSLFVYPSSPSGRYYFIETCHGAGPGPHRGVGCSRWSFDADRRALNRSRVGEYGPHPEIIWGPDERLAVLFYSSEGFDQVYIIDAETGRSWAFPEWGRSDDGDASSILIERKSLVWRDATSFHVDARLCRALSPSTQCYNLEQLSSVPIQRVAFRLEADKLLPAAVLKDDEVHTVGTTTLGEPPEVITITYNRSWPEIREYQEINSQNIGLAIVNVSIDELERWFIKTGTDQCYGGALSGLSVAVKTAFMRIGLNDLALGVFGASLGTATANAPFISFLVKAGISALRAYVREEAVSVALGISIAESAGGYIFAKSTHEFFRLGGSVLTGLTVREIHELLDRERLITMDVSGDNRRYMQAKPSMEVPLTYFEARGTYNPWNHYVAILLYARCSEPDHRETERLYFIAFRVDGAFGAAKLVPGTFRVETIHPSLGSGIR